MGQRTTRVNELLKREISHQLHIHFQSEAVNITITAVEVAADLRKASVFYSVLGDTQAKRKAAAFLHKNAKEIKRLINTQITLKYLPDLRFLPDNSIERGTELLQKIEELEDTLED